MADPNDKMIQDLMRSADQNNPLPKDLNELMRRAANNDPNAIDTVQRAYYTDDGRAYAQSYLQRGEDVEAYPTVNKALRGLGDIASDAGSRFVDAGSRMLGLDDDGGIINKVARRFGPTGTDPSMGERMGADLAASDRMREAARQMGRYADDATPFEHAAPTEEPSMVSRKEANRAMRSLMRHMDMREKEELTRMRREDPDAFNRFMDQRYPIDAPVGKVLAGDEAGKVEATYQPPPIITEERILEDDRRHMSMLRQEDPEAYQRILDARYAPSMLQGERPSKPLYNPMTATPIPDTGLEFSEMNKQDANYMQWLRTNDEAAFQRLIDKRFPKGR